MVGGGADCFILTSPKCGSKCVEIAIRNTPVSLAPYEKAPVASRSNPFADVAADSYYADAVLWAVKEDISKGTTNTTFSPDADCTRAQIVTFLWRCKK